MTNNLTIKVNKTDLPVKEYHGQRVVTLKEIDEVHQRPDGTARRNFNTNSEHLIEGVDYFKVWCGRNSYAQNYEYFTEVT